MRSVSTLALIAAIFVMQPTAQIPVEIAEIWDREHVSNKLPSNTRHSDLIKYLENLKNTGVKIEEVGRSFAGREIFQIEWGRGPLRVFMWSQMHGDEPTATPALIDMFTILHNNRDKEWVKQIEEKMTIRAVPMLNPDGAELYIRRNLQGIDINRDAIDLKTPEGRLLKQLRDDWEPEIGFNLHNQNYLTAAGRTDRQAAISLLVVFGDKEKTLTEGQERNRRLASVMTSALTHFIPGYIARYSDEWTPNAFGDNFSAWGTPTILVETGGLYGKDEMYLVRLNVVAYIAALRALADGSEKKFSPINYDVLPNNAGGRLMYFIFRNATVIDPTKPDMPIGADIGINLERRREEFPAPGYIRRLGDLSGVTGLEEYDASGFNVVGRIQPLRVGNFGDLLFYKNGREVDWASEDLETAFPPDAIFSLGKWITGEDVVKKTR